MSELSMHRCTGNVSKELKGSSMSILVSGFCFIQAVILRVCIFLVFAGADRLFPYRLNLKVAFTRAAKNAPFGSGFGNTPMLEHIADPAKETIWPTNALWQFTPDNAPVSLRTLLRFDSKDERFDIKPKRHSFSVEWRKSF